MKIIVAKNQTYTALGDVMPLIMAFTRPTSIIEESDKEVVLYDPITQKTVMDMRTVGTYSLKVSSTKKRSGTETDRKNAIDDSKWVK